MVDLINGNGYDHADLMVVADYARKHDEITQECISGFYLRKVSEYLSDAQYNVSQTYRTCVVKVYEKGLGIGHWGQDKKILSFMHETHGLPPDYWSNILIEELNAIRPSVVIAMGEYALQTLTGKVGITNFRGSVLPFHAALIPKLAQGYAPPKVVICQHPQIEHIAEEQSFLIRMDFEKAVDLLFNPGKPIDAQEITIARTTNEWLQFRSKYPTSPERLVTDIETHNGFITCASVSFDGYRGCTIPLIGGTFNTLERSRLSYLLAKDLENPAIAKGNQNIGYDKRIYERFGYSLNPVKWDTMLAAGIIAAEFPKRLGFLTSIYCDGAYHKDEGKEFDPSKHSFDQLYEYCAKDAIKTFQIWDKQRKDLEGLGALEFFEDYMMRLFDPYFQLDSVGILQSRDKKLELIGKYDFMRSIKMMELNAITGTPLRNLAYQAVGEYMESNYFPISRHKSKESGRLIVNTDAESFKKMRAAKVEDYKKCKVPYEHAIRFINLILLIRRIDKITEYIDVGVHPDGRIRTSTKLGGTSSGRTSQGRTPDQAAFWEDKKLVYENLGGSFQTVTKHGFIIEGEDDSDIEDGIIGKDVREMYIPDSGFVFVEIDRSQAEARIVDLLAEDYEGLEEYGKVDKHSKNAALIYTDFTYEEIRALYKSGDDEGAYMRQIGKKVVHATNYDMGDYRLSNLANISLQFAHECLKKVHRAKPWIKEVFHRSVEEEVRKKRRLDNPYGRPRMFYKKLDGHGIKVAFSWYPQSTISDGTKLALVKTWDQIDRAKAVLVAENHDSITAIVKRGYLREYVRIAREALLEPIDFRRGTFYRDYHIVIPCEVAVGRKNWGEMKTMRKIKL